MWCNNHVTESGNWCVIAPKPSLAKFNWLPAGALLARNFERLRLHPESGLCLADDASRHSSLADSLPLFPYLANRWNLGTVQCPIAHRTSGREWARRLPSAAIIDTQAVKTTETPGERGYFLPVFARNGMTKQSPQVRLPVIWERVLTRRGLLHSIRNDICSRYS
jgi:hypothetical protein